MLNVDDLTPEQLRAIAAAAIVYCDKWQRFHNETYEEMATSWNQVNDARNAMRETYLTITEAHDAAKKD